MTVVFSGKARKSFLKLDKPTQSQIQKFILRLQEAQNPRATGKALAGNLSGLWRYRVGDYRLVCELQDDKILITILRIGHRKEIYG